MIVDAPCPACKHSWKAHPRSAACARPQPCPIDLVRGRCIVLGVRAPQKVCWVTLNGVPTLDAYLAAFGDRSPPPPMCPACRGPTVRHGSFIRHLAMDPALSMPIRLYRAKCNNQDCAIVTITLYPPFILPYLQVPTATRDDAVRSHLEERIAWRKLAARLGYHPRTLRRWDRAIRRRTADLQAAFLVLIDWFAPSDHLSHDRRPPPTLWDLADRCADVLRLQAMPGLAPARTVATVFLAAVPVWV